MAKDRKNSDSELLFVGEFIYAIDSQRRFAIPSEWRAKEKGNKFFILPGRHNSLQLMTPAYFEKLADKLKKVSIADPKASIALARLGAKAKECVCDKQGRVAVSENLLEYAGIKKAGKLEGEIVLVGAFNSIQIWSKENWNKQQMSDNEVLDVLQKIEEAPDDISTFFKR